MEELIDNTTALVIEIILGLGVGTGIALYLHKIQGDNDKKREDVAKKESEKQKLQSDIEKTKKELHDIEEKEDQEIWQNNQDRLTQKIDRTSQDIFLQVEDIKKELEKITKPKASPKPKKPEKFDFKVRKCINELLSERWEWRTKNLLMRVSGMNKKEFEKFLDIHLADIRQSSVPDKEGNELYKIIDKSKFKEKHKEKYADLL